MKNINYKQIKAINSLPKYEIGRMPSTLGYQLSTLPENSIGYVDNPGADLNQMASAERKATISNAVSGGISSATNLAGLGTAMFQAGKDLAGKAAGTVSAGTAAASSAAAYGAGALSTITGGLQAAKGIHGMNHALTQGDLQHWAGSQINYGIGNRQYKTLTSNAQGAMNVGMQKLKQSGTDLALGLGSAGAGLGSTIGLAVGSGAAAGPIGAGIGLVAGLGAGLGTYFGMKSNREDQMNQMIRDQKATYNAFNTQSLAEANSLGMRDEYKMGKGELLRGKNGIRPGTVLKDGRSPQLVNTPRGVEYAVPNAIINGDELPVDTITGDMADAQGDGKENKAARLNPQDAVIRKKDVPAFKYAVATGNTPMLNYIIKQQGKDTKNNMMMKLPKYVGGHKPDDEVADLLTTDKVTISFLIKLFGKNADYINNYVLNAGYNPLTQEQLDNDTWMDNLTPIGQKSNTSGNTQQKEVNPPKTTPVQPDVNSNTHVKPVDSPSTIVNGDKTTNTNLLDPKSMLPWFDFNPYKKEIKRWADRQELVVLSNNKRGKLDPFDYNPGFEYVGEKPDGTFGKYWRPRNVLPRLNGTETLQTAGTTDKQSWVPSALINGAYAANQVAGLSQMFKDRGNTARRVQTYHPSGAPEYLALAASPVKDMSWLPALNNEVRQQLWRYRHINPNQRQVMEDSALKANLAARTAGYLGANKDYFSQVSDLAKNVAQLKASEAPRMDESARYADQSFNQQLSKINNYDRLNLATIMGNNNDWLKNHMNLYFGNRAYSGYDKNGYMA